VVMHYVISFNYHCRMLEQASLTTDLKHCDFPQYGYVRFIRTGGIYNSGSLHPWWIPYVYASTPNLLISYTEGGGGVAGVLTRLRAGSIMVRFPTGYDFSVQSFQTGSGGNDKPPLRWVPGALT
jgi:hypothetical protein